MGCNTENLAEFCRIFQIRAELDEKNVSICDRLAERIWICLQDRQAADRSTRGRGGWDAGYAASGTRAAAGQTPDKRRTNAGQTPDKIYS
jgi:hypothetical protein